MPDRDPLVPGDYQTGCLICGAELVYQAQEKAQNCFYCGKTCEDNVACAQGHYVCDACHSLSANDLIEQFCASTDSTNPLEMAVTLMRNPFIKMHGPEHHFLVPAVLLAAYYNQEEPWKKMLKLRQARKRAELVKGGSCGALGACGAAVGAGIFISLMTEATPVSVVEWKVSNLMTARSLALIAEHGGPRCCKRNTYLAIQSTSDFMRERFGLRFESPDHFICGFSALNNECLQLGCPFFAQQTG